MPHQLVWIHLWVSDLFLLWTRPSIKPQAQVYIHTRTQPSTHLREMLRTATRPPPSSPSPPLLWCALLCRAPGWLCAVAVVAMELQITHLSSSTLMDFSDSKQKLESASFPTSQKYMNLSTHIHTHAHAHTDTVRTFVPAPRRWPCLSVWCVIQSVPSRHVFIVFNEFAHLTPVLSPPSQDCIQLNQYKLKSEIGKVSVIGFLPFVWFGELSGEIAAAAWRGLTLRSIYLWSEKHPIRSMSKLKVVSCLYYVAEFLHFTREIYE